MYDYLGQSYGYTPATIFYPIAPENQHNGLAMIPAATVRWHSGVQVQVNAGQVNLRQAQLAYTAIAKRPPNMPGLEADTMFAKRLNAFKLKSKQKNAYWQNYNPRQ